MKRYDILNHLARKYNLQRYIEIGQNDPTQNFDKVICRYKVSVDPDPKAGATFQMTSDEFFKNRIELMRGSVIADKNEIFHLIFSDGLHSWEQCQMDFCNAMEILSLDGWLAIHDTSPAEESLTHFPRDKKGSWNGSTYKFAAKLKAIGCDVVTVAEDHGVTLVRKTDLRPSGVCDISWDYFNANRKELLNLISFDEFIKL